MRRIDRQITRQLRARWQPPRLPQVKNRLNITAVIGLLRVVGIETTPLVCRLNRRVGKDDWLSWRGGRITRFKALDVHDPRNNTATKLVIHVDFPQCGIGIRPEGNWWRRWGRKCGTIKIVADV